MQIIKPIIESCFTKYAILLALSIWLCGCNTNYIEIITDKEIDNNTSKTTDVGKTQINIDELLIKKETIEITNLTPIKKIAVLLPMTGKYSKIGKVILEGIEVELNNISKVNRPELSIFDTGDEDINLRDTYYEMLSNNFDYVIGPIRKNLINKIINHSSDKLPILTLNYSNNFKKYSNAVYHFGLLPEDEAICIAEKSIIDGNINASLLYPDNTWGKRIGESFSMRFEELGGKVINTIKYEKEEEMEINKSIKSLLQIEKSMKRKDYLQNILKTKFQYKPYIPNNLDMIFSVGTAKNMRSIKPQFNFNFAEDVPFYSTSHIYNGVINKEINQDLNDIKFCDIPWLYNNKDILQKKGLRESLEKRDLLRFFAIGMDSIKIIYNINSLRINKKKYLAADTGYLQLDEFNKIRRSLIIIKFRNGKAKEVPF